MDDILDYLDEALLSFQRDPSDSDFQRGYEAALKELRSWVVGKNHEDYSETIGVF